jgi:hypothetical protein
MKRLLLAVLVVLCCGTVLAQDDLEVLQRMDDISWELSRIERGLYYGDYPLGGSSGGSYYGGGIDRATLLYYGIDVRPRCIPKSVQRDMARHYYARLRNESKRRGR